MGQNPAALKILRKQTKAFIDDDPFTIVLTPRSVSTRVPGGGYVKANGVPRAPQTVKLIYSGSSTGTAGREGVQVTSDGVERRYDYVIIGEWDMAIEEGDHWLDPRGNRCEVTALMPDNEYERRARASIYAKRAEGG